MEVRETRKHIDTILIREDNLSEPNREDAVFVSTFGAKVGLGLAACGDVEVWLTRQECQIVIIALEAAALRVETERESTFTESFLRQRNDDGEIVPGFVLVADHRGEVGLYIAVKDHEGSHVWMSSSHSRKVIAALQSASVRI